MNNITTSSLMIDPNLSIRAPLPVGKELRIQLALQYLRQQEQQIITDSTPINITANRKPRQSIRQIAMFFQIPKSTLYDRLKSKKIQLQSVKTNNDEPKSSNSDEFDLHNRISVTSHIPQMKLNPKLEDSLFNYLKLVCLSYGNLPNLIQLRSVVESKIGPEIPLGRKWVNNFIKRHSHKILYGEDSTLNLIRFGDFKKWKNHFSYLWRWVVPLLQDKIRNIASNNHFYYIVRVPMTNGVLASCFLCFKISKELKFSLFNKPEFVVFRNNSELMDKQQRILLLNQALVKLYTNIPVEETKLIIFEGFDDNYHWSLEDCLKSINPNIFISLPWCNQIIANLIKLTPHIIQMDSRHIITLELSAEHLDLDAISNEFGNFMNLSIDLKSNEPLSQDPSLREQILLIIEAIEKHESQLYQDLNNPLSRIILNDIFNKLKLTVTNEL